MTFRRKLWLIFAILVVVPTLASGLVLYLLAGEGERGKADASLATSMRVSQSLYEDGRRSARDDLDRLARDERLRRALTTGDLPGALARLRAVVRSDRACIAAGFAPWRGRARRAGSALGVAPAAATLEDSAGRVLGTLWASATDGRDLVRSAARRTGEEVAVIRGDRVIATSERAVRAVVPRQGDFETSEGEYRGTRGRADGAPEELAVFTDAGDINDATRDDRLLIAGILAVFLLLALAASGYIARVLQQQLDRLLSGAGRLAGGDLGQRVPAEGSDEFAQLGREFNRMSVQLEERIREVERHRDELEETIRRVGRGIATGPDRRGILELTVQTAVDACRADFGRALPLDSTEVGEVQAGRADPHLTRALQSAERESFAVGPQTGAELLEALEESQGTPAQRGPVEHSQEGIHAITMPIRARIGPQSTALYVGVISIARRGRPFEEREREMLSYLAVQAVVSIENADLHQTVQRQAVTDELTGLANVREMYGTLDRELERGRRFEAPTGFVLLDIDDFKQTNDTYGHQQGDEVLIHVAGVLRRLSRDLDEPARYGGEELAVVLPQTDLDGAAMLAERMRVAVQELRIPLLSGNGDISVTASFGVASVPLNATGRAEVISAADAALYRAKRAGKNRVVRADADPVPAERTSDG